MAGEEVAGMMRQLLVTLHAVRVGGRVRFAHCFDPVTGAIGVLDEPVHVGAGHQVIPAGQWAGKLPALMEQSCSL
ncbi:MAG: hypothetical protein E6J14_14850 [Chloroflexi bacterium]|nr:MAG: hypothetical protein E6J14_14850 [Chloroflexota bacterium]